MLRLYNTLTKRIETFQSQEPGLVRMYTCGPTVYRYAHLGNLRSYLLADLIRRALESQGYQVIHVKNITDVGHMRQEMLEQGGDKVILAALAEGKTPQELAAFYTEAFHRDEARLNILPAHHFPRATEHVAEMQELVQRLLDQGYAYQQGGNIYFSVDRCTDYGKLSGNIAHDLMEAVRVESDPQKRDPRGFTLWKRAEPGRELKWDSPWGEGFPGWHIECSAMSIKYLGPRQDIHTGGVDNIFPHHENEIAQSEGAYGKPYSRFWVHGQHLMVDGVKMAKSAGNEVLLQDLVARGFDPLAFRYLCLTVRYRHRLNFTFSSLKGAEKALTRLRRYIWEWSSQREAGPSPEEDQWRQRFWHCVNSDLGIPQAVALVWSLARSDLHPRSKLRLIQEFDRVLGLALNKVPSWEEVPERVQRLVEQRERLRSLGDYRQADELRARVAQAGYVIEDMGRGVRVRPKAPYELREERWKAVSSSREVPSLLDRPSRVAFSYVVTASGFAPDVQRCIESALTWASSQPVEVVAVDNGSTDGTGQWLEELARRDHRVRVVHCDHVLGEAAAKNIGLKQALGQFVVLLDISTQVTGDLPGRLAAWFQGSEAQVVGPWGLRTRDLKEFEEVASGPADAMQGYCMAFPRSLLLQTGLMRESFRFYRNLDIDFSFQLREKGYRMVADSSLPVVRHEHKVWSAFSPDAREGLSRKNFRRFLKLWGHRSDLLVRQAT